MRHTNLILLLILALLLATVIEAQRGGGGGSRSSSRSSFGGGRRRSSWGSSGMGMGAAGMGMGYAAGSRGRGTGGGGWGWIIVMIAIFGALAFFGNKGNAKRLQEKNGQIQQRLAQYAGMYEGEGCSLNDNQKTNAKDWFMSNRWRINFRTNDNTFNDFSDLTIKDIKQRNWNSYTFTMRCKDSVGNSDMKGILMHRSNYFGIYFFKNYDNPSSAGQTGSFEWLAYDGVQQGQIFRGKWFYEGYQNTPAYAGTFQMVHQ